MNPRPDNAHKRSKDPEWRLIDRHLAGLLTPSEEAALEQLIRSSPTWAHRYREAEEMARLLRETLGPCKAPERVKAAVRRIPAREREGRRVRRPGLQRRSMAVAACLLVALTARYLFWPGDDPAGINEVAAGTVTVPLKDLARVSEIGVIGEVVTQSGRLGLRITNTLYGDVAGRTFDLPATVRPGQRIALFGNVDEQGVVRVVKGGTGLIALDASVRWEGRVHAPAQIEALVEQASDLRTLQRCLDDLRAFAQAPGSAQLVNPRDGLALSAEDTVRFLGGRFEADRIRAPLMALMIRPDKHLDVRVACSESLVGAEPLEACRRFLKQILMQEPALLRAESEDGFVVLACLRLMQSRGPSDLAPDLEVLAARVECPAMRRAAEDAARTARGEGQTEPMSLDGLRRPRRIKRGEQEAIVMAGCDGHMDRLLVIFREAGDLHRGLLDIRMALNLAVAQGVGVLVLPPAAGAFTPWLFDAKRTGLIDDQHVTFLGLGAASADAIRAAQDQTNGQKRIVLLGKGLAADKWAPVPGADCVIYDPALEHPSARGAWQLRPTAERSKRAQNPSFWTRVLAR
jgi:hypothetical protein